MRAVIKTAPGAGNLVVADAPVPDPGPGEALVRIQRSGLCGTDLLVYDGSYRGRRRPIPSPLVLGHEASGQVVALGPPAPASPSKRSKDAASATTARAAATTCARTGTTSG